MKLLAAGNAEDAADDARNIRLGVEPGVDERAHDRRRGVGRIVDDLDAADDRIAGSVNLRHHADDGAYREPLPRPKVRIADEAMIHADVDVRRTASLERDAK